MGPLTGERRGVAATVLAFYGFIFMLVAFGGPDPAWTPCYGSLALVYGLGFFSLVAGYFWARWYAIGLGLSGLITAIFAMFQVGIDESLLFYGGTHGAVSLMLWGKSMALSFDGRKDWRERFHIDENGADKLGRAVIRAAVSLPYVVIYALMPKQGVDVLGLAALGLAATGLWGLIRLRTWGVLAMGGAAAALAVGLVSNLVADPAGLGAAEPSIAIELAGTVGLLAALGAIAPFARPLFRYLAGRPV